MVIAYHFGLPFTSGGFFGVDIFFVISGYVITLSILHKLEANCFSTFGYFKSRFYRIFPALASMTFVTLAVSAYILFPADALRSAKHAMASLGFISNVFYWKEVGYFDVDSDYKPFLHTWSLAVEWQFYILWPLVVYVLHKLKRIAPFIMLLGILAGWGLAMGLSPRINFVFYMMPLRGWEFALGGLIALIPAAHPLRSKLPLLSAILGFATIAANTAFYSENTLYSPLHAALVCLGAFTLIFFNRRFSQTPLKLAPLQYLGTISYSLYLVHWPVYVLYKQYAFRSLGGADILLMGALTLLLSHLSYKWVEQPFRKPSSFFKPLRKYVLLLIVLLCVALSAYVMQTDGKTGRYGEKENVLIDYFQVANEEYHAKYEGAFPQNDEEQWEEGRHKDMPCTYDNYQLKSAEDPKITQCILSNVQAQQTQKHVLIVGDSNGKNVFEAFQSAFPDIGFSMLLHSGCAPATSKGCFPHLEQQLSYIFDNAPINGVILSARFSNQSTDMMEHTASFLGKAHKPFLIVGATPTLLRNPDMVMLNAGKAIEDRQFTLPLNEAYYHADIVPNDAALQKIAQSYQGYFYDKKETLCPEGLCYIKRSDYEKPLFLDSHHLSEDGLEILGNALKKDQAVKSFLSNL